MDEYPVGFDFDHFADYADQLDDYLEDDEVHDPVALWARTTKNTD